MTGGEKERDFYAMSHKHSRAMIAVVMLIAFMCVVGVAIRVIGVGGVRVELSRMDSLQVIPTPVRSDTFMIDVNAISRRELASHPMVRDTLAWRIFAARVRYGGFINSHQLVDVFADDEAVKKLLPYMVYDTSKIVRYDINIDDEDMLVEHPYITRPFARSVVEYRQKVGEIKSYDELKKLKYFPRSKAEYLEQYINFEKTELFSENN